MQTCWYYRKLHRKVKQKSTLEGADNEADPKATHQLADTDGETHATENGMVVDIEWEASCNGEGGNNKEQGFWYYAVMRFPTINLKLQQIT